MEEIKKELESGKIIISEDVICTIAGIATSEVEGVYAMAGNLATGIVPSLQRFAGKFRRKLKRQLSQCAVWKF